VWAALVGSSDGCDTSIRGHDDDGCEFVLHGLIQERETLDVQHVYLIDEEDSWDDIGLYFFSPLSHLRVDLLSHLGLDLSCVTREEGHEALVAAVDDVDLVEVDRVNDFLSLL